MIIAISGLVGSGKTTTGKIVADRLGYYLVSASFKDIAKDNGVSLIDFQKMAEKDKGTTDKKFDAYIKKEMNKQNSVVSTWLGPWMADGDEVFRVWLFAPEDVRAKRAAKRDGVQYSVSLNTLKEREKSNRSRYQKYYKINIDDTSIFDICINAEVYRPKEIADIILSALKFKYPELKAKFDEI